MRTRGSRQPPLARRARHFAAIPRLISSPSHSTTISSSPICHLATRHCVLARGSRQPLPARRAQSLVSSHFHSSAMSSTTGCRPATSRTARAPARQPSVSRPIVPGTSRPPLASSPTHSSAISTTTSCRLAPRGLATTRTHRACARLPSWSRHGFCPRGAPFRIETALPLAVLTHPHAPPPTMVVTEAASHHRSPRLCVIERCHMPSLRIGLPAPWRPLLLAHKESQGLPTPTLIPSELTSPLNAMAAKLGPRSAQRRT